MPNTDVRSALDAQLVNAIVKATSDVLATMANTQAVFQEVLAEKEYHSHGDISAVIGILGEEGEGMFTISFSVALANLIISRLLGIPAEMLSSEDRCDGVAELVNMITGNAKAMLSSDQNVVYKLTLPTVILGARHELTHRPKDTPYLVLIFQAEGETFQLQVTFKTHV